MTDEQIKILGKALALYRFSLEMQKDDIELREFQEMLEELSAIVCPDVK